jgi:Arc/MetJ-type ribon-helix-helix transcriptional regulator
MRFRSRRVIAIAVAALVVVAGGGAAIAASQSSSNPAQSFLDSVAKHLGISSQKLEDATKAAAIDQVDAALEEGKITKAQADELKARINSGDYPPFFGPFFPGHFHHGPGPHMFGEKLSTAADYLGLTEAQLRTKLADGQSLADVAKAQDKSVDGLKQAILDASKKKLDQLVKDGELTQTQADEMLSRLKSHIDDLVNGTFPRWRDRDRERFEFRGGPLLAPGI